MAPLGGISARMDPEDLREIISAYQKCVAETVGRFSGFVAKYMGDEAAVPESRDAKLFQVISRQAQQDLFVYLVLAERSLIAPEAQGAQPIPDVHECAPKLKVAAHHRAA